jgi:hypothetical protein
VAVSHHDATPASGNIEHHISGRNLAVWRHRERHFLWLVLSPGFAHGPAIGKGLAACCHG